MAAVQQQQQQQMTTMAAPPPTPQQQQMDVLSSAFTPLEVERLIEAAGPQVLGLQALKDWLLFFDGLGVNKAAQWKTLR